MILSDWSSYSSCKILTNYSDLKRVSKPEPVCPKCKTQVPPMSFKISDDAAGDIMALVTLKKDQIDTKEDVVDENKHD